MTTTADDVRELISQAEALLPTWAALAPGDPGPAKAIAAAQAALATPSAETAAAAQQIVDAPVLAATAFFARVQAANAAKAAAYAAAQAAATYAASVAPSSEPPTASTTLAHQTTPQAT